MQDFYRQLISIKSLRLIFAAAFLFFLLVEWGSHCLAFAHASSDEGAVVVYSHEDGHEDLCRTLIRCSDGPRQDQQAPNFGHDTSQRNGFLQSANTRQEAVFHKDPRIDRSRITSLFRAISPPYHPPELS